MKVLGYLVLIIIKYGSHFKQIFIVSCMEEGLDQVWELIWK